MKLYRVTVITPTANLDRGVWASSVDVHSNHITFADENDELIAAFPSDISMITSVETKEQYEARKSK